MEELTLTIDKIVPGGMGLGFSEGKAVFVPFAAPGDQLRVSVEKKSKNHSQATILEILSAGESRIDPGCPVYGQCGGCQLRHISSSDQSEIKRGFIQESLQRIGKIDSVKVDETLAQPSSDSGYRRRAGFKVRVVKRGVLVGFFSAASHRVVDLPGCPVLDPRLEGLIQPLRTLIATLSGKGRIPEVDGVVGDEGVGLVVHTLRPLSTEDRDRLLAFGQENQIDQIWLQQGKKSRLSCVSREAPLTYQVAGLTLSFKPGDFIQVNGAGNRLLVEKVLAATDRTESSKGGVAWDLFCGVGNFTLPLTGYFDKVVGVESVPSALDRLRGNGRRHQRENITPIRADLFNQEGLARLDTLPKADWVLLDPPRNGAMDLVKKLGDKPPAKVVYVSCDPATFARDAGLLHRAGLTLQSASGVDLFPQTRHVEVVGVFKLQG
ncbi:MAG: 23S rRNA (uracil(1939)-C(5))-methyltransferase RlmD [Magnetococcales bacterium]|nr:23S rRNA (uracil(1939)-C(5))-methyltransferase RlmD [Magnetococcales bacterium]